MLCSTPDPIDCDPPVKAQGVWLSACSWYVPKLLPMKFKQTVRLMRDGNVIHEEALDGTSPDVKPGDASGLSNISNMVSLRAGACVYCGSKEQLSREHVIPYALGGTLTIIDGSCEECRKKTHRFETDVLTGPLRMVRYIHNLPSSSKHKDVPKLIPITVNVADGTEKGIDVPVAKAPILLAFYEFGEPKYLDSLSGASLETSGVVTGSYGQDPGRFLVELSAKGMSLSSPPMRPVSFARMIGKIAYCFAYYSGYIPKLENPNELVRAFMDEPDTIGRFVGSAPPPYLRYEGLGIRLEIKILGEHRIAFAEVQLFAASGAPTYLVVLGRIRDGEALL